MARKWKQINKFIEVLDHAFQTAALKQQTVPNVLRVLDFGSGKGYLTFALHDYLKNTLARETLVTGIELRADLVALCNRAAQRLAISGLMFEQGDVRHYRPSSIDIMIALHACDTATEHAIHMEIRSGAALMLCAPCCHQQIRPQMQSPKLLTPLLRHGIHLAQEAEMVTDSLRALLLEAHGYTTQVFEFIALEHTSKNKMILAVKKSIESQQSAAKQTALHAQIQELKDFYGIQQHCLETLLQAPAPVALSSSPTQGSTVIVPGGPFLSKVPD